MINGEYASKEKKGIRGNTSIEEPKREMNNFKYDELKRKYDALLEENKSLKAKLRELTPKSAHVISHHKPTQNSRTLFSQTNDKASSLQSDAEFTDDHLNNDSSITRYSRNLEKIALFLSLF